jgi:hypothetical protein
MEDVIQAIIALMDNDICLVVYDILSPSLYFCPLEASARIGNVDFGI